jgi:hypothetical protein
MDDAIETTNATPPADDMTLVALTPTDMGPAQANLAAWCDRKIAALRLELADLEANLQLATEHGWKYETVAATLARTERRITYYEKMQAAVHAGYLLIPNLTADVFAVRVKRAKQPEQVHDNEWPSNFEAKAQVLPAGEGRYVDDVVLHRDESFTETVDGKATRIRRYVSDDYDNVDFPVALVKPSVLEATTRAMALKVFDQLGVVRNDYPGKDPIVVGILLDPRGNRRRTTFFVAWWLDTASL